jgi:hypothetical protein
MNQLDAPRRPVLWLACGLLAAFCAGCGSGGPPAREDVLAIPDEEHYSVSTKNMIYEFCAKVRKRGVKGAQQGLPEVLENMEGYDKQPLGKHADVYRQIDNKLQEIKSLLDGTPNVQALRQAVEELDEITDQLPGKAVENPAVE